MNCIEIDLSEFRHGNNAISKDELRDYINLGIGRWFSVSGLGAYGRKFMQHEQDAARREAGP